MYMMHFVITGKESVVGVGLCRREHSLSSGLGADEHSISFNSDGNFRYLGSDTAMPAEFARGDIIGLLIDFDTDSQGIVTVFRNGKAIFTPANTIADTFGDDVPVPAVSLRAPGDSVSAIGLRSGGVRLEFPDNDAHGRCSLAVPFCEGIAHGMGRLELAPSGTAKAAASESGSGAESLAAADSAPGTGDASAPSMPVASLLAAASTPAASAASAASAAGADTDAASAASITALIGPWIRGCRRGVFIEEHSHGPVTYAEYNGTRRVRDSNYAEFMACREAVSAAETARLARLRQVAEEATEEALKLGMPLARLDSSAILPAASGAGGPVSVGSRVRVKPGVNPSCGWGPVSASSVGEVVSITDHACIINFPEHSSWHGRVAEMEVAGPGGIGAAASPDPSEARGAAVPTSGLAAVAALSPGSGVARSGAHRQERRVQIEGSFKVDRSQLFTLMPSRMSRNLSLDDDLTTVSSSRGDENMVLGSRGFTRGVHYWEVYLNEQHINLVMDGGSPYVYVGVAERWGSCEGPWRDYGMVNYMAIKSLHRGENLFGEHFSMNDKIGVLLDMDRGVIAFIRDGRPFGDSYKFDDFGPAFMGVRTGIDGGPSSRVMFPCIGMRGGCEPVIIHKQKWLSLPGGSPAANLSSVLQASTLLQRWDRPAGRSVELPRAIEAEAYARFVGMQTRPTVVVARARGGMRIAVDQSTAACTAVLRQQGSAMAGRLRGGDRIKFWAKEAVILGAYRGRLWYRIDGEDAWYLQGTEFDDHMAEAPNNTNVLDRPADVAAEAAKEESDAEARADKPVASLAEFHEWVADHFWSLQADEALVRLVNAECSSRGVEPANLRLEACASSMCQPLALPACFAEAGFAHRLRARFAVLLCLNWRLESLVPYVDFTLQRRSGVLSTADASRLTYSSALGRRFAQLRGVCFAKIKHTYFDSVLNVTVKETEKGSYNDDRPSDVPRLTVDRMNATVENLWAIPSLKRRIRRSLAGQLARNTSGWPGSSYRRHFAWHEDEGQRRSFFVDMAGEKADDNGGPYRSVIESAAALEPAGPLGLFVPCPNAEEPDVAGGKQDVTIINPHPSASLAVRPLVAGAVGGEDSSSSSSSSASSSASSAAAAASAAGSGAGSGVDSKSLPADLVEDIQAPADSATKDHQASLRLSEYRNAGLLAGSAVRQDIYLPLNLPPALWSAMSGQPVTAKDIFEIDGRLRKAVKELLECRPAGVTGEILASWTAPQAEGAKQASVAGSADAEAPAEAATGTGQASAPSSTMAAVAAAAGASGAGLISDDELVRHAASLAPSPAAADAALERLRSLAQAAATVAASRSPDVDGAVLRRAAGAVTFASRSPLVLMLLDAVARAGSAQLSAWASGIANVLPMELFPLFTAAELETLFCGNPDVDVDLLSRVAEFPTELHHSDPVVGWLFEVLKEEGRATRQAFLAFVAARTRMPASADSFVQTLKIKLKHTPEGTSPDSSLPTAATCFFALNLPRYSSKEILRKRLLTALDHAFEMDLS